jgi:hypothetical protein
MLSSNVCGTHAYILSKRAYHYRQSQVGKLGTKRYICHYVALVKIEDDIHCIMDAACGSLQPISIPHFQLIFQLQFIRELISILQLLLQFYQALVD